MKKFKQFVGLISIIIGSAVLAGGVWGVCFTYSSVASENIITPADATIAESPVRGPLTLKSQVDIIRHHTLEGTDNRTYAEMSRDEDRSTWITATSLMTALNLGIIAYGVSALAIGMGIISLLIGIVLLEINNKKRK